MKKTLILNILITIGFIVAFGLMIKSIIIVMKMPPYSPFCFFIGCIMASATFFIFINCLFKIWRNK